MKPGGGISGIQLTELYTSCIKMSSDNVYYTILYYTILYESTFFVPPIFNYLFVDNYFKLLFFQKINQKNSWTLPLIDYIKEVMDVRQGDMTNFQVWYGMVWYGII